MNSRRIAIMIGCCLVLVSFAGRAGSQAGGEMNFSLEDTVRFAKTLEQTLAQRFLNHTVDHWVSRCTAAGIGAHRCILDLPELLGDPWVVAHELSATREHDEIGLVTTCGPAPRLSATPVRIGRPAPKPGSDAADILADIGLAHRLDDLIASGVVRLDGVAAG